MKKVLSIILSIMMLLSMVTVAFADDLDNNESKNRLYTFGKLTNISAENVVKISINYNEGERIPVSSESPSVIGEIVDAFKDIQFWKDNTEGGSSGGWLYFINFYLKDGSYIQYGTSLHIDKVTYKALDYEESITRMAYYHDLLSNKDGVAAPVEKAKIKVATSADFKPFEYYDENGELTGFDIDLMNYVGERAGIEIEYVNMPFERLIPAVINGDVFCAISSVSVTKERDSIIDYSREYLKSQTITFENGEKSVKYGDSFAVLFREGLKNAPYNETDTLSDDEKLYVLIDKALNELTQDRTVEKLIEKYQLNKPLDEKEVNVKYSSIMGGGDPGAKISPTPIQSGDRLSSPFAKINIPFPDTINDRDSWLTYARYKDTGEVIPLSVVYNGRLYATVPQENKDREIEAFVPEEVRFTDDDSSNPDFHNFKMLSRVGVIKGNEKGEANINHNVTRAEAVAMVMRFSGLNKIAMQGTVRVFDDVTADKWYYREVLSAYHYGLIKGDSERVFSPQRNVTREEITVMIARALQYAGLRCSESSVTNYADEDKISYWAKDAYESLGQNIVSDYDNTDADNPVRLLNPHKPATRKDVAYILNNTRNDCQIYPSQLAEMFGFDEEMPVIDGSTSTYPFTQSVYSALFFNGETHPRYPLKHSKSHTSYQRLINGEVDMLFASVYPASDILKLAEDKGVELELIPIAYDAMIFFTNKDNPATGLTKEQISNIYVNDAYNNWSEVGGSDALLYPYCRNNDSGSHAQMEKHFLNGNEIHPEVQKETSYTMSNVLTDVMAAKTLNPLGYGLGYSIYYYYHNMDMFIDVHNNLKLLSIDGVMPTDDTIADGSYPLSNNTYVVLRKDTPKDSPARKMAEFMLTEAGQICVENAGYGKLRDIP